MATIKDVAILAGTSTAAVSAVLSPREHGSIRVGEATRAKIRQAAIQLGYTPNPLARSLVTHRTGNIGLIFPYSKAFIDRNPFNLLVQSGVTEVAVRHRYNLMLHTAIGDSWLETAIWSVGEATLPDPRIDGAILVAPDPKNTVVERCGKVNYPCVSIIYTPKTVKDCVVNSDDVLGGYMATEHLVSLGHRRIGHLQGIPTIATSKPRKQGYLNALEKHGIPIDETLIAQGGYDTKAGYLAMEKLLALPDNRRPTAVFAVNDQCADGAIYAAHDYSIRIPYDIALVGFDDTAYAATTSPPLTSVHVPTFEMALEATEMLVSIIEGKQIDKNQVTMPVSLVVRASSGRFIL